MCCCGFPVLDNNSIRLWRAIAVQILVLFGQEQGARGV